MGGRGLKYIYLTPPSPAKESLPAWGAWIEISAASLQLDFKRSLPAWGAWIEITMEEWNVPCPSWSLPAWGAWIEIHSTGVNRRMM